MEPGRKLKVVDLSHVLAGPTASHYLALLGADVIKVEKPRGGDVLRHSQELHVREGVSVNFAAVNGGKRSLAVDLKVPRLRDAVFSLAAQADVFIENFRPGVIDLLGLGHEALCRANPRLVYVSISGYGTAGNWRDRGAYDHVVQALTGMMMLNGEQGGPPVKVGFPVIDAATGMYAALAIQAALHRREASGTGCRLEVSMTEAAVQLMLATATSARVARQDPPRPGNRGFSGSPGAVTMECADGWLAIGANTEAQFRTLCEVLGLPDLASDATLVERRDPEKGGFVVARDESKLRVLLEKALAGQSASELERRLNERGVPAAKVRTLSQFLEEAQQGLHARLQGVEGELRQLFAGNGRRDAPVLGAHTGEILATLGLTPQEIERYASAKSICLGHGGAGGNQ